MAAISIRIVSICALTAVLVIWGIGSFYGEVDRVVADEKFQTIHIFPAEIASEDWLNPEQAKVHDLSQDAILNLFGPENSAYVATSEYLAAHPMAKTATASSGGSSQFSPQPSGPDPTSVPEPTPGPEQSPASEVSPEVTPEVSSAPEETVSMPVPSSESSQETSVEPVSEPLPAESQPASQPEAPPEPAPQPEAQPAPAPSDGGGDAPSAFYRFFKNIVVNEALATGSSDSYQEEVKFSCDKDGTECISREIEFGGFGVGDAFVGRPIRNIQLRLSFAGSGMENGGDDRQEIYSRLVIEYFFDNVWSRAGEIPLDDEISNSINGGYFLHALPFLDSWDKLDEFGVRLKLEGPEGTAVNVFIDGLWLEIETNFEEDIGPEEPVLEEDVDGNADLEIQSDKIDFSSDQVPVFEYNYSRDKGFLEVMASAVISLLSGDRSVNISAVDTRMGAKPEIEHGEDGDFSIKMKNPGFIKPGKHNIRLKISDGDKEYDHEQEFVWGSLLVNLDKSAYRPGEKAKISLVVLDDIGQPACDASIVISIKSSLSRIQDFSTRSGSIVRNPECGSASGGASDYLFEYQIPPETGVYEVEVVARTKNGLRSVGTKFEVVKDASFIIERRFPAQARPGKYQEAVLSVTSGSDFDGTLEERLPLSFDVFGKYDEEENYQIRNEADGKIISWKVSLKAGEAQEFKYIFSVPDFAPAFYLIGPAKAGNFSEPRLWQFLAAGNSQTLSFNSNPPHRCNVEPFMVEVLRGSSINYKISLKGSGQDNYFVLLPGDLPPEINLVLDEFTGLSPREIGAVLDVRPDAKTGSFTYSVIYQEPQDNGRVLSTACQFNLIIK